MLVETFMKGEKRITKAKSILKLTVLYGSPPVLLTPVWSTCLSSSIDDAFEHTEQSSRSMECNDADYGRSNEGVLLPRKRSTNSISN